MDSEVPQIGAHRRVAIRVRDLIRQIALEHELEIISGKVARDHVHVFLSYLRTQRVSNGSRASTRGCCCTSFRI